MAPNSDRRPKLKRRQLLATLGAGAVAGCGSSQDTESPTDEEPSNTGTEPSADEGQRNTDETDCVPRSEYEELRQKYNNLRENALVPPYIVADRRNVSVTYETLEGDYRAWQWDSRALESQVTSGNFARELTYSQLEYLNWNSFGFEGRSKYRELGNYGLYYQLNPFVIPSNFGPLSEQIHNEYQSDLERVRAAWNFVTQLNDYVSEIRETPRFPLETLLMGGGDCEDSAILLGSVLYSMPADLEPKFWFIDIDNPTDPEDINHVILSADIEGNPVLIETTSSSDMNPYNQVNGFSVEIEPSGRAAR